MDLPLTGMQVDCGWNRLGQRWWAWVGRPAAQFCACYMWDLSSISVSVVDRIMAQRCPCPKPKNLWVGYLTWKRGLYRYDEVKDLGMGRLSGISRWVPVYSQESLREGGRQSKVREGSMMTEAEASVMCFEGGGQGHQPTNCRWPLFISWNLYSSF